MQQPHVTVYADIAEVRMEVQGAECNRLLADGWVLLGVYPLTTVGEMTEGESGNGQEQTQPQDIQRYVRRSGSSLHSSGNGGSYAAATTDNVR